MADKNTTPIRLKTRIAWLWKKPELIISLLLLTVFFLPWFSNPVLSVPGYGISSILDFFSIPQPVFAFLVLLAFLIPLGGAAIIILSILDKPVGLLCMITGMLPLVIVVILYFKTHLVFNQMSIGIILTVLAAIVLLLIGANK